MPNRRNNARRKSVGRRPENGVHAIAQGTEQLAAQAEVPTTVVEVLPTTPAKDHFADMKDDLPFETTKGEPMQATATVEKTVNTAVNESISKAAQPVDEKFIANATNQPSFSLTPGDGWLFFQVGRDNTFVWQGHMHVPPYGPVFAIAKLDTTKGEYEVTLRQGREKGYAFIAEFKVPMLGDKSYVDSEVSVPLPEPVEAAGLKITSRKYVVRAFKDERPTQKNILRIQLPAIRDAQRATKVPM